MGKSIVITPNEKKEDDKDVKGSSNISSTRGRRIQLSKIVVLAIIPVLILTAETSYNVYEDSTDLSRKNQIKEDVLFSIETANLIHYTQIERGMTALYISSKGDSEVYKILEKAYRNTNNAAEEMSKWLTLTEPSYMRSKNSYLLDVQAFRDSVNPANVTIADAIKYYTDNNMLMINWIISNIKYSKSESKWQTLVAYHMLLMSKEQFGIERALGSTYFSKGKLTTKDLLWYNEKKSMGEAYLKRAEEYTPRIRQLLDESYFGTDLEKSIVQMQNHILRNPDSVPSVVQGVIWFDNMTLYINIIKVVQYTIGQDIIERLDEDISTIKEELTLDVLFMALSFAFFPTAVFLTYKLTKKLQAYAHTLHGKTASLEVARKRNETILYQMLPVSVTEKLLKNETVLPELYASVTIYISDIVGFTSICSQLSPLQVVEMLNFMYKMFDSRIEKFDVYKVETIGDAYIVASGLPQRNGIRHVAEICSLALDTLDTMRNLKVSHRPGQNLKMRIGLNTGSVVAGVVGNKMPRYCLFGDTVNIASMMESSGKPSKIQITEATMDALRDFPEFQTEKRGSIEITGKGLINTYWLIGIKRKTSNLCSQ